MSDTSALERKTETNGNDIKKIQKNDGSNDVKMTNDNANESNIDNQNGGPISSEATNDNQDKSDVKSNDNIDNNSGGDQETPPKAKLNTIENKQDTKPIIESEINNNSEVKDNGVESKESSSFWSIFNKKKDKYDIKPILWGIADEFQGNKKYGKLGYKLDKNKSIKLCYEDENVLNKVEELYALNKGEGNKPQYLQQIFTSLGNFEANKFLRFLNQCLQWKNADQAVIYQTFVQYTIPFMLKLILEMKRIFKKTKLEYLHPFCDDERTLTRGQIACILSGAFFNLNGNADHFTFADELGTVGIPGKFDCYIRYFEYVRQQGIDSDWFNKQCVTILRRSLKPKDLSMFEYKNLANNNTKLSKFEVFGDGCIEDEVHALHADFANMYIGGGVLSGGNVQEEIRFTVNLECLMSKFFAPTPMQNNEAIIILGSQQFFNYQGYGSTFMFNGERPVKDKFCTNKPNHLCTILIGIDAIHFSNPKKQSKIDYMLREMIKCYVGYSIPNKWIGDDIQNVSTGNWGCGIFNGDPQLKALLQWISITLSKRNVKYYTFTKVYPNPACTDIEPLIDAMIKNNITVGQLWKVLCCDEFVNDFKSKLSRGKKSFPVVGYLVKALKLKGFKPKSTQYLL